MANFSPAYFPVFRAFDANGNPLAGGKLYTYAAGTTTPLATYTDATGGTPNTNPVELDANGEANVWLGSAAYKFVLQDATGAVLWTADGIKSLDELAQAYADTLRADLANTADPAKGDALIGVKLNATGSVARTQHVKNAESVSITDFGAVAGGPAGANTTAIQAAATHCAANQVAMRIPAGEFEINAAISVAAGIAVIGEGIRKSRIHCDACDGFVLAAGASKSTFKDLTISQRVRYTTAPNAYTAIRFSGTTLSQCYWHTVRDVFIDGFGEGIYGGGLSSSTISNVTTVYTHASVTFTGQCLNNVISDCHFGESDSVGSLLPTAGSYGVKVGDGVINSEGCTITNTLIYGVETAIWNRASINVVASNNILDGITKYGILHESTANAGAINCNYNSNYIGVFGAGGDTGIYLANAYAPSDSQNRGTVVRDNEILAYAGSTLNYGILVDGAEEERNIISGNRVQNTVVRDCKITAGSGHRVSDNIWRSGVGFETTVPISYINNVGVHTAAYPSSIGSFTPVAIGTSTAGAGTYTLQNGGYKIIDKMVFFNLRLAWSAHTGTGDLKIDGLPIACKNVAGYAPAVTISPDNLTFPGGATAISALINTGTTTIELRGHGTGLTPTPVAMDTAANVNISGFYEID